MAYQVAGRRDAAPAKIALSFPDPCRALTFAYMISISKCLEVMHSGAVFSIRVVSYDKRRRNRCGRVLEYPAAMLVWGNGGKGKAKKRSERALTALEKSLLVAPTEIKRDPNHAIHYTRNIRLVVDGLPTEAVQKIHPPLIIQFNGITTTP